jgi:hypothetical protein
VQRVRRGQPPILVQSGAGFGQHLRR